MVPGSHRQIPVRGVVERVARKHCQQRLPEVRPIKLVSHVAGKRTKLLQSSKSYGKSLRSVWPRAAVRPPHQSRPQCYQAPLEFEPAGGACDRQRRHSSSASLHVLHPFRQDPKSGLEFSKLTNWNFRLRGLSRISWLASFSRRRFPRNSPRCVRRCSTAHNEGVRRGPRERL